MNRPCGYVVMRSEAHAGTKDERVKREVKFAIRQAVWDRLHEGNSVVEFITPRAMKVPCNSANRTEHVDMNLQRTLLILPKISSGEQ